MPHHIEHNEAHKPASAKDTAVGIAQSVWSGTLAEIKLDMDTGKKLIPGNSQAKDVVAALCPGTVVGAGAAVRYAEERIAEHKKNPAKANWDIARDIAGLFCPV